MESHVTVSRTSSMDAQDRHIIVKLDGEPFATLKYGNTATRAVTPGHHSLRVDNTWNKKRIEFDLAPGEHITFRTINQAGRWSWLLGGFLGAGVLYCSIEREA